MVTGGAGPVNPMTPPHPGWAPAAPGPPAENERRPVRSLAVAALGLVAVFSLFLSTAAVWIHTVLFDSDRVAASVDDSLSRPEVAGGLADFVTDQIFELARLEQRSSDLTPDRLDPLLPFIQAAAQRAVSARMSMAITSDRGRAVIVEAARQSHRAAVTLLEGKPPPPGVTVGEDTVSLNLLPLLLQGLEVATGTGLVPRVSLPELTPAGSITGQIQQLELAFQVDLPDNFGQLEIYRGDQVTDGHRVLGLAQQSVKYLARATVMVVLLTLVSAAATVGFARRRSRAIALLGVGAGLVLLAQRVLVERIVDESSKLLIDPTALSLVSAVVASLTSSLLTGLTVIVWVSVAAAVIATVIGALARGRAAGRAAAPHGSF